jgi:hypothetical protein
MQGLLVCCGVPEYCLPCCALMQAQKIKLGEESRIGSYMRLFGTGSIWFD